MSTEGPFQTWAVGAPRRDSCLFEKGSLRPRDAVPSLWPPGQSLRLEATRAQAGGEGHRMRPSPTPHPHNRPSVFVGKPLSPRPTACHRFPCLSIQAHFS